MENVMETNAENNIDAYFDNSATTPVYPEVRDLMVKIMDEDYGNNAAPLFIEAHIR